MDMIGEPGNVIALSMVMHLLLLTKTEYPVPLQWGDAEDEEEDRLQALANNVQFDFGDAHNELRSTLHHFRLCVAFNFLHEDLGFWVKLRSTTWFSRFLLDQYDDGRWIQMFRMTKHAVISLSNLLKPHIQRENTRYRLAIRGLIHVACTLFKLAHGANLTVHSEMFAIG
ncbi:hypothetical protein M758_UG274300 [Ceratodon purpureus]|nr:hypothetical protein M758_UG274300 [Ceratodon purpureus]